ncbi:MAG: L,D-transpeptidase family protein [Hylemonella sp.]
MKEFLSICRSTFKGWNRVFFLAVPVLAVLVMWYASASNQSAVKYPIRFDFQFADQELDPQRADPEGYLTLIQNLLFRSEYVEAVRQSEILLASYPNFQLGQWLYAELLNLKFDNPPANSKNEPEAPYAKGKDHALSDLKTELARRLHAMRVPYQNGTVPSGLGYLAPNTEYFGVVDASVSRMYVFKNKPSEATGYQLELLFHSYASIGLNGINKQLEGDSRSPLGLYYTQKIVPHKKLPDLYGAGALTLNYPNSFDLHRGRSGSGIWIHGSPSAQYSRAPLATDGCIVLPNDAMQRLLNLSNPRGIPIFVQENIKWVSANPVAVMPEGLVRLIQLKYPAARAASVQNLGTHEKYSQMGILNYFSWVDQGQRVALVDVLAPRDRVSRTYWIEDSVGWTMISESRIKKPDQSS